MKLLSNGQKFFGILVLLSGVTVEANRPCQFGYYWDRLFQECTRCQPCPVSIIEGTNEYFHKEEECFQAGYWCPNWCSGHVRLSVNENTDAACAAFNKRMRYVGPLLPQETTTVDEVEGEGDVVELIDSTTEVNEYDLPDILSQPTELPPDEDVPDFEGNETLERDTKRVRCFKAAGISPKKARRYTQCMAPRI